jgi:hypothetical protein
MVEGAKSWLKENSTLVYFLIGQAILLAGGAFSLTTYMVNLEARVALLEDRGSPHLSQINNRLTVLESKTDDNKEAIDRIVAVMIKELHVMPQRDK